MTTLPLLLPFVLIAGGVFAADVLSHKRGEAITLTNAAVWSLAYILAALLFALGVFAVDGPNAASLFLAGFVMEKALSVDNLMVFVAIFSYYQIPDKYQYRVLRWGFAGAIVFRLIFVAIGAGSLQLIGPWVGVLFGLLVLWSAFAMIQSDGSHEPTDYSKEWYIRWARKWFPFTPVQHGGEFLHYFPKSPRAYGTPLLLSLVAIEISDVLFSFDSVPAVIAVTRDPVLIYTAMIFAIMGLRALYFVLTALLRYLRFLPYAVISVLLFIGFKMLVASVAELIPDIGIGDLSPIHSLAVVLGTLAIGVVASIIWPERESDYGNDSH